MLRFLTNAPDDIEAILYQRVWDLQTFKKQSGFLAHPVFVCLCICVQCRLTGNNNAKIWLIGDEKCDNR